jgi:prepilin-type N-terminal cleavage/methylation domain-containing protein
MVEMERRDARTLCPLCLPVKGTAPMTTPLPTRCTLSHAMLAHAGPGGTRRCVRGFTLIELLVVISVIALLIGILLPALAASRKSAKTLMCLGNLRNFGQGVAMYSNDNKGFIPRDYNAGQRKGSAYEKTGPHVLLPEVVCHYLGGPNISGSALDSNTNAGDRDKQLAAIFMGIKIMRCPNYTYKGTTTPVSATDPFSGRTWQISYPPYQYSINAFRFPNDVPDGTGSSPPTRLERVPEPTKFIYVCEVNRTAELFNYNEYDMFQNAHLWPQNDSARMIGGDDNRHDGGFNAFFFDFHGKTLKFRALNANEPWRNFTPLAP